MVLGTAARNGHPINFWTFSKHGLIVASSTILVAWAYVAVSYFAVG